MAQEQAVPGWVIAVAFAVPGVIMLLVLRWALRGRARHGRHRRAEGRRRGGDALARGSAAEIPDGGEYKNEALLRALSIKPEDHGPDDEGNPHDEGWAATMLGLRSKVSSSTDLLEPHLYWGPRAAGQVFVRIGPDEKIAGGSELYSERHLRSITVLRADAPEFELEGSSGRPRPAGAAPPALARALDQIGAEPRPVGPAAGGRRAEGDRGHAPVGRRGVRRLGLRPVAAGAAGRRDGARAAAQRARGAGVEGAATAGPIGQAPRKPRAERAGALLTHGSGSGGSPGSSGWGWGLRRRSPGAAVSVGGTCSVTGGAPAGGAGARPAGAACRPGRSAGRTARCWRRLGR